MSGPSRSPVIGVKPVALDLHPSRTQVSPFNRQGIIRQIQKSLGNQAMLRLANPASHVESSAPTKISARYIPISPEAEQAIKEDVETIVGILKGLWISRGEQWRIVTIALSWWHHDEGYSPEATPHLDHFLTELKKRTYAHRPATTPWVEIWSNAYDEIWRGLGGERLAQFKEIVGHSRAQGTSGASEPDPESFWKTLGKQELIGLWGMLKGLGVGIATLADDAKWLAVKQAQLTGIPVEDSASWSDWLAKQYDVSGEAIFGEEYHSEVGLGLTAADIGTVGGSLIWQLMMAGRGGAAMSGLGIAGGMRGVEESTHRIASVISRLQTAGTLSAASLVQDQEFLAAVTALAGSAASAIAAGVGLRSSTSHATAQLLSRVTTMLDVAQLLPVGQKLVEIWNSSLSEGEKGKATGPVLLELVQRIGSLAISHLPTGEQRPSKVPSERQPDAASNPPMPTAGAVMETASAPPQQAPNPEGVPEATGLATPNTNLGEGTLASSLAGLDIPGSVPQSGSGAPVQSPQALDTVGVVEKHPQGTPAAGLQPEGPRVQAAGTQGHPATAPKTPHALGPSEPVPQKVAAPSPDAAPPAAPSTTLAPSAADPIVPAVSKAETAARRVGQSADEVQQAEQGLANLSRLPTAAIDSAAARVEAGTSAVHQKVEPRLEESLAAADALNTGASTAKGLSRTEQLNTARARLDVAKENYEVAYRKHAEIQNARVRKGSGYTIGERIAETELRSAKAAMELADGEVRGLSRPDFSTYAFSDLGKVRPCFVPGTLVRTLNGDRAIETLKEDDAIWSFDPVRNAPVAGRVVRVLRNWTERVVRLTFEGGGVVTATPGHPFWLSDLRQWQAAGDLRTGDRLATWSGTTILSSCREEATFTATVNLEVASHHTFYVGAGAVLVHNGSEDFVDSGFAKATLHDSKIYKIVRTLPDGSEQVVYVGKTWQETIEDRFAGHVAEKGWKRPQERPELIMERQMTAYETAVWESHYKRYYELLNSELGRPVEGNQYLHNDVAPISEEKFKLGKRFGFNSPCP